MKFKFTGDQFQSGGFTMIPEGEYPVQVVKWGRRDKENGNVVFDIDLEILEGEYEDHSIRYFQTISPNNHFFVVKMLKALGLLSESDLDGNSEVEVELKYTDAEKKEVSAIVVNGEKRKILGRRGTAVVIHKENPNKPGKTTHMVEEIKPYTNDDDSATLAPEAANPTPPPTKAVGAAAKATGTAKTTASGKKVNW